MWLNLHKRLFEECLAMNLFECQLIMPKFLFLLYSIIKMAHNGCTRETMSLGLLV